MRCRFVAREPPRDPRDATGATAGRRCRRSRCAVDDDGTVVISSRETAIKVKNIRRDPHVSLCVFGDGFYGQWVQVDGTAEIVSLPDAMDGARRLLPQLLGRASRLGRIPRRDAARPRCLIRITVTRAGPT